MSRNFAFVVFACFNMRIAYSYTITIGRSSKADYVIPSDPNTDVYPITQQALSNMTTRNGGVLTFEAGVYMFSANLKLPNNVSIIGSGINITTLKLANGAKAYFHSTFIYTNDANKITLQGLTLDGNTQKNIVHGINAINTTELSINAVEVQNFLGNGISMTVAINVSITNSYVTNNALVGINVVNSSDIVLKNNTVSKNGNHGFNVRSSKTVAFDNNTASDNGNDFDGCGITFQSLNITATNCIVSNFAKAGVCMSSSSVILKNFNVNDYSKDIRCIALANNTLYFNHTNVVCNGKPYGPEVHPSKNSWKGKIVKIVIPCIIGIIAIVCISQLIALYRNHRKEQKQEAAQAAQATQATNAETA